VKQGPRGLKLLNHSITQSLKSFNCLIIIILLFIFALPVEAQVAQKKSVSVEKRISDLEAEITKLKREVEIYNLDGLPDALVLCDKKIPLFRNDIRERFEREFFQFLENKGLMTIIIKRYFKYLNMINEETQKMGLPSDLIYLVITESYLNPRALSRANAAGMWQFIKETGKREGLNINDNVDERYNMKKATKSALTHLKRLHGEFGDWLIAMAAYNAGAGRLREAIENQGTRDFFELYLPEETERYIFRILSLKEIVLNRERYGFFLSEKDLYKPVHIYEVVLETDREIHASTIAKCMDVSYKTFKDSNLQIRRYRLPKGTYYINVPYDKKEIFLKRLKNYPYINVVREN
jgi:membrane-bound lytic murein transglycosylase D